MMSKTKPFSVRLSDEVGEGRSHEGVILVPPSVRNEASGTLISGIEETLGDVGREGWIDRVEWLGKG